MARLPHPLLTCTLSTALWLLAGAAVAEPQRLATNVATSAAAEAPATSAQDTALPLSDLSAKIEQLAREGLTGAAAGANPAGAGGPGQPSPARIEVEVGTLDPRLKLAPCQRIEPYLPAGLPAWGRTRIGLKCVQGSKAWNVTLPITVHAWHKAQVLATALPAGTQLEAGHLIEAEVDLAAGSGAAVISAAPVLGRLLARPLAAGATLRQADLKARQWFAAGETVRVIASGPGWNIATEGQALSPGLEGQIIRVRTENGRLLQGRPVAERQVEVGL